MEKLRISIMEMFKAMKNRQNEKGEAFAPQTSMLLTHGGGWKGSTSNVCAPCVQMLYERGEVSAIRHGFQFMTRR